MSDLSGAYAFLPWLRRGLGAAIDREDFGGPPAPRAAARITVALNEGSLTAAAPLMLAGPGDVARLDPQSVSRVWPRPAVNDAEPNNFPLIEFHDADLPWRYTPAKATGRDRLRPWLCLIVLRDAEISSSSPATTLRVLPSVTVTSAAVLPRLDQSWAWAHTQVSGPQTIAAADVNALLATTPQRVVSRMLAPRRLDPQTPYTALLVPAFERGRLAGIGQDVPDTVDGLAPAWSDGASNIELPIYYQWRFQTGTSGDFEYLVRQLQARVLPPTVGTRDMDVSHPGAGLPAASPQPLALEGALKALTTVSSAWPEPAHGQFVQALGTLLNTPAALLDQPNAVRVVAPPLYGRWHAARATLESGQPPPWFQELNADPRTRVAAGLGTQVVQSQQQALMAAAWQQLDRIRAINERLRFAQFAREAAARIHVRHVATAGDEGVVQLTAPVHTRVRTGAAATSTIAAAVAASAIGAGVLRGQFRRIARPFGPIARRSRKAAGGTASSPPASPTLLARMNAGTLRAAPPAPTPKSMATPARLGGGVPDWRSPEWVSRLQAAPAPTPAARDFRAAATAVFRDLSAAPARATPIVPVDLAATRETLVARLDPRATITASIRSRLRLAPGVVWEPKDPLEPVMAAPEVPQPMSEALIALSQDWLLPGLELVLPNTVALLATNRPFVEAFMVGLNHEFARELLWNEYPTDQRGSYFRQFWNAAGRVPPPGGTIDPETTKDIRPIHAWAKTASLGDNGTQPDAPEPLVLLVRGDLLRRYPNALVYAVNAVQQPNQPRELGDEERHPLFRGRLDPDVSFFGFELTADEVRGGPGNAGWFFVLQEQPSEPRFGLDVGDAPAAAATKWLDLAWGHLAASPAALRAITYIDLNAPLPDTTHVVPEPGEPVVAWHADSGLGAAGSTASHLAYITLQRPARVAIHGSQMLP
jgi:hypothetical protein